MNFQDLLKKFSLNLSTILFIIPIVAYSAQTEWQLVFSDTGTSGNWEDKWFLDGKKATVEYTSNGIKFSAGRGTTNADHAVLWAKPVIENDVKIEYDFTRLDNIDDYVNILFIQAQGIGTSKYPKDISTWHRPTPKYNIYFDGMDYYNISYANVENEVRARQCRGFIVIKRYTNVDMFQRNKQHHLTVIKEGLNFQMTATNLSSGVTKTWKFTANATKSPVITKGRIGLRHMSRRISLYKNFKIYTKSAVTPNQKPKPPTPTGLKIIR